MQTSTLQKKGSGRSSAREIRKRTDAIARAQSKPITVFWGSMEDGDVLEQLVFAKKYRVLSRGVHVNQDTGEEFQGTGELVIQDQIGVGNGPGGGRQAALKPSGETYVVHTAAAIAAKFLELSQDRGLVALAGDADDEPRRRAGLSTWVRWRRESAGRVVGAHYADNERVMSHPGTAYLARSMNDQQNAAQKFLECDRAGMYKDYVVEDKRYSFKCLELKCGRSENDGRMFRLHLEQAHSLSTEQIAEKYLDQFEAIEEGEGAEEKAKAKPVGKRK